MKNSYIIAMIFAICLTSSSLLADSLSLDDVKNIGKKTTDAFHHRISTELHKYKKDGVMKKVEFCENNAQAITDDFNKHLSKGVTLHRVSLKNRNHANAATEDEVAILKALELLSKANAYLPDNIVQMNEAGDYKYYRPITLSKRECLSCHGKAENMQKKLRLSLDEHYPEDKAINYNRGDFRGAFVVEIRHDIALSKIKN